MKRTHTQAQAQAQTDAITQILNFLENRLQLFCFISSVEFNELMAKSQTKTSLWGDWTQIPGNMTSISSDPRPRWGPATADGKVDDEKIKKKKHVHMPSSWLRYVQAAIIYSMWRFDFFLNVSWVSFFCPVVLWFVWLDRGDDGILKCGEKNEGNIRNVIKIIRLQRNWLLFCCRFQAFWCWKLKNTHISIYSYIFLCVRSSLSYRLICRHYQGCFFF